MKTPPLTFGQTTYVAKAGDRVAMQQAQEELEISLHGMRIAPELSRAGAMNTVPVISFHHWNPLIEDLAHEIAGDVFQRVGVNPAMESDVLERSIGIEDAFTRIEEMKGRPGGLGAVPNEQLADLFLKFTADLKDVREAAAYFEISPLQTKDIETLVALKRSKPE